MTAAAAPGEKARIRNDALESLSFLVGEWRTTGTHPLTPGVTLAGRTTFEWHEGGAFLLMRSSVDHPQFPDGLAIIGSDDRLGRFVMTYFDERGISRILDVAVGEGRVSWEHKDPTFAQRLTITAEGERRLASRGLMSKDGGEWTDDLSQRFDRLS